MSRPLFSSTAVRRLSQPQTCRLFSTFRPALCLSAFSAGEVVPRRPSAVASSAPPLKRSAPQSSTSRYIRQQHACFSASSVRPATKVTQNPRTGDDGQSLMIGISPRAAERLRDITDPTSSPSAIKEENPYHHLRITVTSGGCHGFQYMMSLEGASKIDPEEDTVFEGEADEASTESAGKAKVVMDEPSLELLHGSTVDYTTELIGSQFKIVDNPRATSNCGCGTSFDVSD
ncbi:FeS cluster insertion protein [Penicillium samsonianum]|uniref:FeS cluster insertion protein n=1 Tax=Penicillium samsonianum TaxID=1882272 RepID=UPI002547A690|nr:FeS cluster insertion protein [Penicillium samsonianum]KAJ6124091.1 FeS cluster insertion protein [Penicillium samsonianum]